jgi:hypothetical protein
MGRAIRSGIYSIGAVITVSDRMQSGYQYKISAAEGKDFPSDFQPKFTPAEMLEMGVFEGKYCNDCKGELPADWFRDARISNRPDPAQNCFGVKSRQPLSHWQQKGWIFGPDPRGWFQWYCRYFRGRRLPEVDAIQIKRWRGFSRHSGQVRANCGPGDIFCRPRQRQALLQWSHDPFI